jgi:hypothetical protein
MCAILRIEHQPETNEEMTKWGLQDALNDSPSGRSDRLPALGDPGD